MREKVTRKSGRMGDRVRAKAEKAGNRGGGSYLNTPDKISFFKPKKGAMELDILPYRVTVDDHPEVGKGELWYQRTIFVHYGIGIEEKAYLCPRTVKKKCPICEHLAQLKRDPDADEDLIKQLRPKERELYNVIDLSGDSKDPMLWEISFFNFGETLAEEIREGEDPAVADFAELKDGKTLKVRFKESTLGTTKFLQASKIDFEDRDEDYDESVLEDVADLDKMLNVLPYDALEKIFLENGTEDEVAEKPARKVRKEEPEEKEKEEKEKEEKEKEEEEQPVKKSRRTVKEEPEEEEEEEEEEPKKKASSSKGKCPHGHTFGEDADQKDECEDCKLWDDCMDRYEELEKEKKSKKK